MPRVVSKECDVLDILLAVQEQAQKGAEEMLDALAWNRIDDVTLELLGAKIGQALGESIGKPGAEHDDELWGERSAPNTTNGGRDFSRRHAASTRTRARMLTAMSGLSARTYSCGGEGSRFGRGGVFSLGSKAGSLSTLWKNFRMPWRSSN